MNSKQNICLLWIYTTRRNIHLKQYIWKPKLPHTLIGDLIQIQETQKKLEKRTPNTTIIGTTCAAKQRRATTTFCGDWFDATEVSSSFADVEDSTRGPPIVKGPTRPLARGLHNLEWHRSS